MAEFIYNGFSLFFGGGMSDQILSWTSKILAAVSGFTASSGSSASGLIHQMTVADFFHFFSIIGCDFLILYFFADMATMASRDMMSLEKLVLAFIKLLIAFSILLYLPELVVKFVELGAKLYYYVADAMQLNTSGGEEITYFGLDHWPDWEEEIEGGKKMKDVFEDGFSSSITKILGSALKYFLIMLIPSIIGFLVKVAGLFIITSNAIMLVVRCIFAPIAVVQVFEEGQRSAGVRYLKKFLSLSMSFAIIAGVLYASSFLTQSILTDAMSQFSNEAGTKIVIDSIDDIKSLISWGTMAEMILPQIAVLGAMIGAGRISDEIMGV